MSILRILVASVLLSALPALAQTPAGQATGMLTAKGKTVKLAHATAFVDATDKKRPVVLLLTEKPVPSSRWKSYSDVMTHHLETPIAGLVFRIDPQREVDTAEYFMDRFPTSTSGVFVVTFEGPAGKAYAGTVKSTPTAAKLSEPVSVDATFSATLK